MAEYPIQRPNTNNPNSLLPSGISRQDPYRTPASSNNSEAHSATPSRRLHSFTYRDYPENTGTFHLYHPRPDQTSPDQPPRKKMHRQVSEGRTEESVDRSTPSASSQSGIEDQETEADQSQRSEASPAPTTFAFAVPKKKRTRTLTTPHQAAVLHALLAQVCVITCDFFGYCLHHSIVSFSYYSYAGRGGEADWFERSEGSGECVMLLTLYGSNSILTYVRLTLFRSGSKTSARRPNDRPPKAQPPQTIPHMLDLLPARHHRAHPLSFIILQTTQAMRQARDTQSIRGPAASVVGA
jgi:hypothetical protein